MDLSRALNHTKKCLGDLRRRFLSGTGGFWKDTLVYGLAASIGKLSGLFLLPVFTRTLTSAEYGTLDICLVVAAFAGIPGLMQLESAVGRFFLEARKEGQLESLFSTAFWAVCVLSVSSWSLLACLSPWISAALFKNAAYSGLILAAASLSLTTNFHGLLSIVIRFEEKRLLFVLCSAAQVTISFTVSYLLVAGMKAGVLGAILGQAAGTLTAAGLMMFSVRYYLKLEFDRSQLREMLRYSCPLVPAVAGSWINNYASRFVMLAFLSMSHVGIFAVATKLASPFSILVSSLRTAWYPFIWRTLELENHREVFRRMHLLLSAVLLAAAVAFGLASKPLLALLANRDYLPGAPLVGFLALASALGVIGEIAGMGIQIQRKTVYNAYFFAAGVLTNLLALLILVPLLKLMGIALAALSSAAVVALLFWTYGEKLYSIGFRVFSFLMLLIATVTILSITAWWQLR